MSVVAVVGLGYVGLPLAVEFGKKFRTIGFDLSKEKIERSGWHILEPESVGDWKTYRYFIDHSIGCLSIVKLRK